MATIENVYTGDGSTVLYSFTFPYIETTDVKLQYDGVDTTEYSLANATTVELVAAPTSGTEIRIYRDTKVDAPAATFFPGSAIRAQDLNDNFEQSLFVVQEASFNNSQSAADSAAALATAQAADVKSDQANTQSAAAEASAAQAQIDATQAAADAASAQSDATQAATDALAAQIAADQANIAVQAAAIYVPVSDVASIPASPVDQDRVKVVDSTGIYSFSPITGLPIGPSFDAGLFVNIVYQSSGSTWVFVEYGANDPDVRYILDENGVITPAKLDRTYLTEVPDGAVTPVKLDRTYLTEVPAGAVTPVKLDRAYLETAGGTLTGDLTGPTFTATDHMEGVGEYHLVSFTSTTEVELAIPAWATRIELGVSQVVSSPTLPFEILVKKGTGTNYGTVTSNNAFNSWINNVSSVSVGGGAATYLRVFFNYFPGINYVSRGVGTIYLDDVGSGLYNMTAAVTGAGHTAGTASGTGSNLTTYTATGFGNVDARPTVLGFKCPVAGEATRINVTFYA